MKPIIFNTDMVRAILEDRKTVTRRAVKPPVTNTIVTPPLQSTNKPGYWAFYGEDGLRRAPYHPGDILYVRETWCWCYCWDCGMDTEKGCADETSEKFYNSQKGEWGCYGYRASFEEGAVPFGDGWCPSIHMPREAARIFLRVTDVRVERLQDISPGQCVAEGADDGTAFREIGGDFVRGMFSDLWDSTIKPADRGLYDWYANPWVWVIEFERISREEGTT